MRRILPMSTDGPNDNFDLNSSHVLPALIRKFHEAKHSGHKEVVVWGTGTPMREFLHVDDLAAGVVYLMDHYDGEEPINCGAGSDVTIRELAETIGRVVGFEGQLVFDLTKPDGTPRKLMDSSRSAALGWKPKISLEQGIQDVYRWFLAEKLPELA